MNKLTNKKEARATGISVWRKHMGLKHPPELCNRHTWLFSAWNPGCHQTGARRLCVQASVWLTTGALDVEGMPSFPHPAGRVLLEDQSPADLAATGPNHRCFGLHVGCSVTQCWLTSRLLLRPLPLLVDFPGQQLRLQLSSQTPAPWVPSCTLDQSHGFKQSRADFTAFESPPSRELTGFVFFKSFIVH